MIPPMNELIILEVEDTTQPKNRYGLYPTIPQEVKANVRSTSRVVTTKEGLNQRATLTIKFPAIPAEVGQQLKAVDKFGVEHNTTILSLKDITNFGGNRVIYREANCGA